MIICNRLCNYNSKNLCYQYPAVHLSDMGTGVIYCASRGATNKHQEKILNGNLCSLVYCKMGCKHSITLKKVVDGSIYRPSVCLLNRVVLTHEKVKNSYRFRVKCSYFKVADSK